jgi:DNA (cytosine-5)-methyltransferase 1
MTKFLRLSRFGMTFKPLTESRGEDLLTLYLAGFPAKTSAPQDKVPVSPAADQDSGLKWQGLLGKYDHNTRSWKTAQCSLLEDLEQCLEIWPRWGLMQDGVSYQQQTLVRPISESEFGLWRTPGAQDGMRGTYASKETMDARLAKGGQLSLPNQMRHRHLWPTVTATANQLAPSMQSRYANPIFPTPTTGGGGGERSAERAGTGNLDFMARTNKWPTPRVCDYKGGGQQMIRKDGKSRMDQLCFNVEYQETGRLNPTWVEWLMGWPLGWTDLKPLETDKCQEWQQQHSNF